MLNTETAAWIVANVRNVYPDNSRDTALQALSYFLDLTSGDDRPMEACIQAMSQANDLQKQLQMKEFTDIERFMKDLLKQVSPDVLNKAPAGCAEWSLKPLYTQAFRLFAPNFSLSNSASLDTLKKDNDEKWHFVNLYQFRNRISHGENPALDPARMTELITSMLVCELRLCYTWAKELAALWAQRQAWNTFDRMGYCRQITDAYNELCRQGFGYLDVHWYADSDPDTTGKTIDDLRRRSKDPALKLLGEAGTGKSTALRRMEFLMAQALANNARGIIPMYLELNSLTDDDHPVLNRAARQLGIEETHLAALLASGEICLLLDGFNEILDLVVKKKVANELDSLNARYPASRILLTDRAMARANIPTLAQARRLYLSPITMEARAEYFKHNCKDEAARKLILSKADQDPAYFEGMNTPLKLKQLVDVVTATHTVPEDLLHSYVQHLLEREMNEKKDPNIEYLNVFLQVLALQFQEEFSMMAAQRELAKCKTALGYTQPDTLQCLKLALDMGLLVSEEANTLRFASPEYQEYFEFEADANDLISVLD